MDKELDKKLLIQNFSDNVPSRGLRYYLDIASMYASTGNATVLIQYGKIYGTKFSGKYLCGKGSTGTASIR